MEETAQLVPPRSHEGNGFRITVGGGMEKKLLRAFRRAGKLGLDGVKNRLLETMRQDDERESATKLEEHPALKADETSASALLNAAQIAMESGKFKKAFAYLTQIGPQDESLVRFLTTSAHLKDLLQAHPLGRKLVKVKHDAERLHVLKQFFLGETIRSSPSSDDLLALNICFADPLIWFARNSENLRSLAILLTSQEASRKDIANLFRVFETHSHTLLESEFETALWGTLLEGQAIFPWRGTALLHIFLTNHGEDPSLLWGAWEHFHVNNGLREWQALHNWACVCVRESFLIPMEKKSELASHLSLVAPSAILTRNHIHAYQQVFGFPLHPRLTLQLVDVAKREQASLLEQSLLVNLSQVRRLRQDELIRLDSLSEKTGNTILKSNTQAIMQTQAISDQTQQTSIIVNRFVEFKVPTLHELSECLLGFSSEEKKFVSAIIRVGPWLNYFAFKGREGFRPVGWRDMIRKPGAKKITKFLSNALFSFPPKLYVYGSNYIPELGCELPPYFCSLSNNDWGRLMGRLSQWMGLCRMPVVLGVLSELGSEQISTQSETELLKWLNQASKELKANLYQLQKVSTTLAERKKTEILAKYLSRLTTLVCKDSLLALCSLSASKADDILMADLEMWLLLLGERT